MRARTGCRRRRTARRTSRHLYRTANKSRALIHVYCEIAFRPSREGGIETPGRRLSARCFTSGHWPKFTMSLVSVNRSVAPDPAQPARVVTPPSALAPGRLAGKGVCRLIHARSDHCQTGRCRVVPIRRFRTDSGAPLASGPYSQPATTVRSEPIVTKQAFPPSAIGAWRPVRHQYALRGPGSRHPNMAH